jgi:hypothetical protein
MSEEPDLIEEIRAVRRRLWEEHGGTVEGYAKWLREMGARHPELMASPASLPRRLSDEELAELARLADE